MAPPRAQRRVQGRAVSSARATARRSRRATTTRSRAATATSGARHVTSLWTYYESPQVGNWQYTLGVWLLLGRAQRPRRQWEPEITYYFSNRLSMEVEAFARHSSDWLIRLHDDRLRELPPHAVGHRGQSELVSGVLRHELRAKMQGCRSARATRRPGASASASRLRADGTADDFSVNSFGVQRALSLRDRAAVGVLSSSTAAAATNAAKPAPMTRANCSLPTRWSCAMRTNAFAKVRYRF